jgi:hypothetical protein
MATYPDKDQLERAEQVARITKLVDDVVLSQAELVRAQAETRKTVAETQFMPRAMVFQAMLATAALLGAGAAIAKLFFP